MISTNNKRVLAKIIDIYLAYGIAILISWLIDEGVISEYFKALAIFHFFFFNLSLELFDSKNRTIGKRLFKLKLDFPNVQTSKGVWIRLFLRKIIDMCSTYAILEVVLIYLNNGKRLLDLIVGSDVTNDNI